MQDPSNSPPSPASEEALARWAIRDLPDAVMLVGLDQRIRYINPSAAELLGVAADEALDRPCYEVFPSKNCRVRCEALGWDSARTETHELNTPLRRLWVTKTAAPLRDEQQCVVGLVAILRELPSPPPDLGPARG